MRIAVVHNLVRGGAHRRLTEQVAALDADVVEFTTSVATPVTARPFVVPLDIAAPRLTPLLRPPQRLLDLRRLRTAWLTLGELADRAGPDVIFANPDSVLRGAVPVGARSTPVLRYCDEPRRIDYEPELRASLNPRTRKLYALLRRAERRLDRSAIAAADAVATNSRYTAGRILAAYGRPAQVLPCGVPDRMTPDPYAQPRHLLSVGSLIPGKGHDLVIEAAALSGLGLPVVIVAHHGEPAEEDRLHTIARRNGVQLRIRTGISDDDLVGLYQTAFTTLYLAAAEPLGLASIEAQACGSPVVVAGEGGLPETVAPFAGLVVPRSSTAAGRALADLAGGGRREQLASAARATASTYGWHASAAALIEVAGRLTGLRPIPVQRDGARTVRAG
jgi:glycosyltransferase involved in cell wall biosynthesis